jgi:periplasmic copper chaperone A
MIGLSKREPTRMPMRTLLLTLAMNVMTTYASAQDLSNWTLGKITVKDSWARLEAGGRGEGNVYFSILNNSDQPETLLTIEGRLFGSLVLRDEADGDRLQAYASVQTIPPWSEVVLKPGGLHLALTAVSPEAKRLKAIPLRLRFERSGVLDILVPIVWARSREFTKMP